MAESKPNPAQGAPAPELRAGAEFDIQKLYIKDVSFETPNSPQIFTEQWEPNVNIELNTNGQRLGEGVYEVVLSLTVTTKVRDKVAFLVEIQQAGVFNVGQPSEEALGHLLGSRCPTVLFPFAREVVAELVSKGGFPPLLLAPVNFDTLYAQHLERLKQQGAPAPTGQEAH